MKSKPIALGATFKPILKEANPNFRVLFFVLFFPLTCMLFLLEWQPQILIFIFLGYSSAMIGFFLARATLVRDKLLKEEDQLFRKMVNYISDVVIIHRMDDNSNVFVSPSIKETLGFSTEEIICKYGTFIIHPDDRRQVIQFLSTESLRRKPTFQITLRVQKKEGDYLWMELTGKAIIEDETGIITHTVLSFRDVSDRIEMEKTTRHFAEELIRKDMNFKPITKVGNFSNIIASHDLKEPLRTVVGYINLLDQKHSYNLDDTGKECVEYIKKSAQRMEDMLDDMLAFSQINEKATELEIIDTKHVVDDVIGGLNKKISDCNALISNDGLPKINADVRQFRHLIQNLIENALKYRSSSDPFIAVTWEKNNGFWKFGVHDNGIGIEPAFQTKIFDMFRRLHPVGGIEGSGVGLAICKKIVENHGGEIWVESEGTGQGSSFFFTIPVKARTINLPVEEFIPNKTMKVHSY